MYGVAADFARATPTLLRSFPGPLDWLAGVRLAQSRALRKALGSPC